MPSFSYSPGDVVMIQPDNLDSVVDDFIQLLDLDPNKILKISKQDKGNTISPSLITTFNTHPGYYIHNT